MHVDKNPLFNMLSQKLITSYVIHMQHWIFITIHTQHLSIQMQPIEIWIAFDMHANLVQ